MARMDRVSIRVEKKVRTKVKHWAAREGLPPAELYRRLFEWASDQYSRVGDLELLRKMSVSRSGKETT
jgi:hypothetical protein